MSTATAPAVQQTAPTAPALPPASDIEADVTKTFRLKDRIQDTIRALEAKRTTSEIDLVKALASETNAIACVPLDLEKSKGIVAWQASEKTVAAQLTLANDVLAVVERRIECLKHDQPREFHSVLERERQRLESQLSETQAEIAAIDSQLKGLKQSKTHQS